MCVMLNPLPASAVLIGAFTGIVNRGRGPQPHQLDPLCRGPDYAEWRAGAQAAGGGWGENVGIIRELSAQLRKEGEQFVGGAVAAWADARRSSAVKGPLFDGLVGVDVDLGCFGVLVPEPERDHGDIDAGVQQLHGGGVPVMWHAT